MVSFFFIPKVFNKVIWNSDWNRNILDEAKKPEKKIEKKEVKAEKKIEKKEVEVKKK